MKIPYGISNFGEVRTQGYYYVDKTPFLTQLENLGPRFLLFLRPRRIGKSLFLSLLEYYYDIARAERFDDLFRGLWIHEHPTSERGRYLVLPFDFSGIAVDGHARSLQAAFSDVVRSRVRRFATRYRDRIPLLSALSEEPTTKDAASLVADLFDIVATTDHKVFVLIDEYDNFTNRLLSSEPHDSRGSQDTYASLVERTGFVRTFYAALKAGTASGAVSRMFITGVTPLLLDDLSSGFNIATNISQDLGLATLAGFTRADVERAVEDFLAARPALAGRSDFAERSMVLDVLEQYYDGYRFSPHTPERIFNADMVLYFLSEVDRNLTAPADMLDPNVRTDYEHFQRLGALAGAAREERRALLETILSEGGIQSTLIRQFGVRALSSQEALISLLYYVGMLTLGSPPEDQPEPGFGHRLVIPNRVIRKLQWEHLARLLHEEARIALPTRDLEMALDSMAAEGDIAPFLDLFHDRVINALGVKDLRRLDEKSIKLMMLAFISQSRQFHPLSEKEFAQGYCDLFLGVPPIHPTATYAWLLELKYLRTGAKAQDIERAFARAFEQVARYASDERLVPLLTQGRSLKAGALVFVGAKQALFRPWPPEEGRDGGTEKPARGTVHGRRAARPRRR